MPPNSDVYGCAVIYMRNVANFIDPLGFKPVVDFFFYLDLATLKYRHLHRWAILADSHRNRNPRRVLKRDDPRRQMSHGGQRQALQNH